MRERERQRERDRQRQKKGWSIHRVRGVEERGKGERLSRLSVL